MSLNSKKQVSIGAIISYFTIAFSVFSGLVYTPWMIRTVGDDQYALYTLAISVINIFLMDFGISSAVTKFLSNYYAEGRFSAANQFMGIIYKLFMCLSAVIGIVLFCFYLLIDNIYQDLTVVDLLLYKRLFLIVASYSVLCFPFITQNSILMANERFVSVKLCGLGQKVVSVMLMVVALATGMGIYVMVLANALSNFVFVGVKYFCIRKETALRADLSFWDKNVAKSLFDYSVWVTIGNIAGRFIFSIMPTLIATLIGSVEVTVFSLASSLEGYVFSFSEAINGMFMPKISRVLGGNNSEHRLAELMLSVGRFHVCTIGLIFIGFVCLGKEFVDLWLGSDYEAVYFCALFLIFPSLIDVPQQIARTTLLAKGIVKEQALIYLCMAIINVICSIVFIPIIGVLGAAVSICVAYLLRTIAFNILYHKRLNIQLGAYFKKAYLRWTGAAAATMLIGSVVGTVPLPNSWWGLVCKAICTTIVYLTAIILLVLDRDGRNKAFRILKRK